MKRARFLLVALVFGLAGCETDFNVSVNSFSSPEATKFRRFTVVPGTVGVTEEDLQFREAKQYLERVLVSKGFQPQDPKLVDAEILISLSYGIGEPVTYTTNYSVPIMGQTGGGTATYNATSYGSGGMSTTTGTITQPATYGIVGSLSGTQTHTLIGKWLEIKALDTGEYLRTKRVNIVWETRIASMDSDGDLRKMIPIMLAGSRDYLAASTGKIVKIELTQKETDLRLNLGK